MKNNKIKTIFCIAVALVLVAVIVIVAFANKRGVDKEYEYNTEIISNTNAPVEGEPEVENITGFVEDTEQTLVELPYAIEDTGIEVVSIGKYTGVYTETDSNEEVEEVLAIVVKNTTDQVVSYSTFDVTVYDDITCSFSPTNIPAYQSALVLTNSVSDGELTVPYSSVTKFACVDSLAVMSDSLPLLEDTVGVDYKDGSFIITNLTNENLGDVYIRYKKCGDGNAYLGGKTYSTYVSNVEPFETYTIADSNFDEATSVIIAVESINN